MDERFNVTLLECIERVPGLAREAVEKRGQRCAEVLARMEGRLIPIREILLIGSGTSNTAAVTARPHMEQLAGLPVRVVLPDDYLESYAAEEALVVVISQTGTSIMTTKCLERAREAGALTVAVSEARDKDFVRAADAFLDMGCGYEEHPTRTIGYSLTVLTLLLLGLEIGKAQGTLEEAAYGACVEEAARLPKRIAEVTEEAMKWLDRSRWQMLRSDALIFTGRSALYGVAIEASTKVWELPKLASFGYELDEAMHGPNYGFNSRHCVIVLDDGVRDSDRALALASYMKKEFRNGLVVGPKTLDEQDLAITPDVGRFSCLLYAAAIQVLGYRLAEDLGRDLMAPHDNHVMYSYFVSHSDYK